MKPPLRVLCYFYSLVVAIAFGAFLESWAIWFGVLAVLLWATTTIDAIIEGEG